MGYLSQIENDKASPSLETLAALGAALEVPIAWFLLDTTPPPRVVRANERRTWEGEGLRVEEVDGAIPRNLSIIAAYAEPGHRTGFHAHPGDEHHILLSGRVRLTQGEHVVELGPGDYVLWDGTLPHDAENIGDTTSSLLLIRSRTRVSDLTDQEF